MKAVGIAALAIGATCGLSGEGPFVTQSTVNIPNVGTGAINAQTLNAVGVPLLGRPSQIISRGPRCTVSGC